MPEINRDLTDTPANNPLNVCLISLHGLIRHRNPEYGRDVDTGGQVRYVLELAEALGRQSGIGSVCLLTRQIVDPKVSEDYAQIEEVISDNVKILRIPFGPKRYLKKEALWPYIEMFVDQTIQYFRRSGIPDVIHGHYADAGFAGAQLARLLHVPFVFTGHSLGRVKRQRLGMSRQEMDELERKYKFRTRCEAEETALETADLVVTSTSQEIQEQYELYHHYQPDRMEVIPPGVDVSSFHPPGQAKVECGFEPSLRSFLNDLDKPPILALARPDERKNLDQLVHVFGQEPSLREKANLILLMGTRQDMKSLPRNQRAVIQKVIHLIDDYDLYGSVAYPKMHTPSDIPELYRWVAERQGVFVNAALTEPFGLTLLEAAASGVPIVATNDGGPRDIIANCNNGLLVDPLDRESITKALLQIIGNATTWQEMSRSGIDGVLKHYSWDSHVSRYLRDVQDILSHEESPALKQQSRLRRIPDFDRLIITDLDNTLTGDDEALQAFKELLQNNPNVGFGIATGRSLPSATELLDQLDLPKPDLIASGCGTQLHYGPKLIPDKTWQKQIGHAWDAVALRALLSGIEGLTEQSEDQQSEHKLSYVLDEKLGPSVATLKKRIREAGLRAKVVMSLGCYLDLIPVRGGSDMSLRHLLWKWGFSPEKVLVAGDSGNDAGMLLGRTLGVVVANHGRELNRLRNRPRIYFAQHEHAQGIIEGIEYYDFLGNINIPNDQLE